MKNKKTPAVILRSTILWLIIGPLTVIYSINSPILFFVSSKLRHKILCSWGRIFTWCAKNICGVKYMVKGKENIINSPAIIASNHQSMWKTASFVCFFPQHVWILKKELLKIPFFGWTLRLVSPIAINRSERTAALHKILHQSVKRIQDGFWILVFPEGTRAPAGELFTFKTGIAKMAINLSLPVIPVAHNAGYCMPKGSFFLYPGTINVQIGKPISPLHKQPEELTYEIQKDIKLMIEKI